MKKLITLGFILSVFSFCYAEEQPPFEVKDPAATENFRQIYYLVDQLTSTSTLNISSGTIATFNSSSATIIQLITTSATIQNINGTSISGPRNRIFNGAMVFDQRNEGLPKLVNSVTTTYGPDRFYGRTSNNPGGTFTITRISTNVAQGFSYCLQYHVTKVSSSTVSTDTYHIGTNIEGNMIADIGWGTPKVPKDILWGDIDAKPLTLSFWVMSSTAGVYSGAVSNYRASTSYPFQYTINVSSAWEYKTINIPNRQTDTFQVDNSTGLRISWDLGSGTNNRGTAGAWNSSDNLGASGSTKLIQVAGSTWSMTGVQIEISSTATSFEYRPYITELTYCQRYYEKTFPIGTRPQQNVGSTIGAAHFRPYVTGISSTYMYLWRFATQMRTLPTGTCFNPNNTNSNWRNLNDNADSGTCNFNADSPGDWNINVQDSQTANDAINENIAVHVTVDADF